MKQVLSRGTAVFDALPLPATTAQFVQSVFAVLDSLPLPATTAQLVQFVFVFFFFFGSLISECSRHS